MLHRWREAQITTLNTHDKVEALERNLVLVPVVGHLVCAGAVSQTSADALLWRRLQANGGQPLRQLAAPAAGVYHKVGFNLLPTLQLDTYTG